MTKFINKLWDFLVEMGEAVYEQRKKNGFTGMY
jgi:hypothetical protein